MTQAPNGVSHSPLPPSLPTWACNPKYWLWPLAAVLVVVCVTTVYSYHYDAVHYISIGRHIFHGELASQDSPFLHFAPGYPLIIAPLFAFGYSPFLAISLMNAGLMLLLMWGVYRWSRRLVGSAAVMITVFVMVNYSLWYNGRQSLSELAMMVWMVWAIEAMYAAKEAQGRRMIGMALLAILAATMASLTRQTAVLILAGLGVQMLALAWMRQVSWKKAIGLTLGIGLPVSAILLAWILYDRSMAEQVHTRANIDLFANSHSILSQAIDGTRIRMIEIGRLILPGLSWRAETEGNQPFNMFMLVCMIATGFLSISWCKLAYKTWDPLLLATPFYVLTYVFWPFDQDGRFMLPILPVFVVSLWVWLALLRRYQYIAWIVLIMLHFWMSSNYIIDKNKQLVAYDQYKPAVNTLSQALNDRIEANTFIGQPLGVGNPFSFSTGMTKKFTVRMKAMFELASDRQLMLVDTSTLSFESLPPTAYLHDPTHTTTIRWLLLFADEPVPSGFHLLQTDGAFSLAEWDGLTATNSLKKGSIGELKNAK